MEAPSWTASARARALWALLGLLAALLACGGDAGPEAADAPGGETAGATPETHVDDLPGIRRRGELRVLVQRRSEAALPRNGSPLEAERDRLRAFAEDLGVTARFVALERFDELLPALLDGRGDLVADNLTVTPEREGIAAFSIPVASVREVVVTRADDEDLAGPGDLVGRRLAVQRGSSFWTSAQALREQVPELVVEAAPETLDAYGLLDAVAGGSVDLTLMDSNVLQNALSFREDLRAAFDLGREQLIAWAVRPDAQRLRRAVDAFLAHSPPDGSGGRALHDDDLAGIRERGVLRVITRNGASTYFISRGELVGFEYDLARRFAKEHGLRLRMVVPPSRRDLLPWLRAGKGDLVAAGLTADPERAEQEGVVFSRPTNRVEETVVVRSDDPRTPETPADLAGRRFHVRRSSSYWKTLTRLRDEQGVALELVAVPEEIETEQIIERVASGEYDLTLADSHVLAVETSWRSDVRGALALGEPRFHGWALRPGATALREAVDAFFQREYRGLFYNVTHKKYFGNPSKIAEREASRPARTGRISPWDELVRPRARSFGFDWRLVVAQVYQESRFDPKARSFAGARGLLQVMPRTAREHGFENLEDPATGLDAGLTYLDWVRARFEPSLAPNERTWLSLAAYNVGAGHVRDARRLASDRGLDPDRWFGHVEQAMLLKERPEVHRNTRFGYARGREPVHYVRAIRDRYHAYTQAHRPR